MHKYIEAYQFHRRAAEDALTLFRKYCGCVLPRVPGMGTVIRLAFRIHCGRTVEEAAAREYVYRWSLAIKEGDQIYGTSAVSVFGTPHALGM